MRRTQWPLAVVTVENTVKADGKREATTERCFANVDKVKYKPVLSFKTGFYSSTATKTL
jgi:hypothetical protein